MKIVVDTNVLISGVFFGGFPRKIFSAIVTKEITAHATAEIAKCKAAIERLYKSNTNPVLDFFVQTGL